MKVVARVLRVVAGIWVMAVASVHAGGPTNVCNNVPVKYAGAGNVGLNYDGGGSLGSRTKAQADGIVTTAISLWTNVNTSTVNVGRGADLPVDVTAANYTTYLSNFSDGLSPVIYDSDGSIIDAILGVGQKNQIIGLAASASSGAPTCQYTEGFAIISGFLNITETTLTALVAHELGHLIGLDHAQLDGSQGLSSANYPLMYPTIYRSSISLHEDDVAAVSALYPDASLASVYGQLTGTFKQTDGTPIRGANLWAREITNNKVYGIVSDYLMEDTGFFKLLLPAGTYTLHAEAVRSWFNGVSRVGPYAAAYPKDPSFQSPLYSGGRPMTPVTLGNDAPIRIDMIPGCTGTVTFKQDGSGEVGGTCTTTPPDTTPPSVPAGLTATAVNATQVNLTWTASTDSVGVTGYRVYRNGVLIGSPTATSYSDTGLTPSTTYAYTVAACDAAGNCSAQFAPPTAVATMPGVAPNCTLTASPTTLNAAGGTSTLTATCAPEANSYAWTNTGFASTVSSGTVSPTVSTTYSVVGSNAAGSGNTASATVTVCTYSLSSTHQSVPPPVTNGTLSVTSPAVCSWTASSSVSWIAITAGSSGSGNGSVSYSVAANASGNPRTGILIVAGQTFTVMQAGTPVPVCNLTASASTISLNESVTLTATCTPEATSYAWTPAAGLTAGPANTATVTPTAAGTYQYSVQGSNSGGTGNIASTLVTVTPATFHSGSDCLFNWAERTFPNFFSPAGMASSTLEPFYYRHYSQSQAYLGTSIADSHVYYVGPLSGHSVLDIGALSGWLMAAGCH